MDITAQAPSRIHLMDLPNEILLQVFDSFGPAGHNWQEKSWRYPERSQPSDLPTLQNSRLVCKRLNALVTPLLCPVLRVTLDKDSLHRLDHLTRNPLIADGVRGLDVNLRYRPALFAQGLRQYHTHVQGVLDKALGTCDFYTEFGGYAADDESDRALRHRAYSKADNKLWLIRSCWTKYVESATKDEQSAEDDDHAAQGASANEDNQPDQEDIDRPDHETKQQGQAEVKPTAVIDTEAYQNLLQENSDLYVKRHCEQHRMLTSGSFIRSLTEVLSRSKLDPFVWFGDDEDRRYAYCDPFDLVDDIGYLSRAMVGKRGWLDIEKMTPEDVDANSPPFPASVLVELPLACHEAGVSLRGLSIGCFPLTKHFDLLLPAGHADGAWIPLAIACQGFEVLHFAARGMSCTPHRPVRLGGADSAVVDAYISAVCSSPRLEMLYITMKNFGVLDNRYRRPDSPPCLPYLYHRAENILGSLTTKTLRDVTLMHLEMNATELETLVQRLSESSLLSVYFTCITLDQGQYVEAMSLLRNKIVAQNTKPRILFASLQGAEFGPPTKFDDENNMSMYSSDPNVVDELWDRLEEHDDPASLQLVQSWVTDVGSDEPNPLLPGQENHGGSRNK